MKPAVREGFEPSMIVWQSFRFNRYLCSDFFLTVLIRNRKYRFEKITITNKAKNKLNNYYNCNFNYK